MEPGRATVAAEAEREKDLRLELPVRTTWCDEEGELWFEGIASSTGLDRQRERMSGRALGLVASRLGRGDGQVKLLSCHPGRGDRRGAEELGQIEECEAGPDELRVRGRLKRGSAAAWRLYEDLRAGRAFGLSLGGRVKRAHWELDNGARDVVRVIDEVEVDHIAVCSPQQAVNPATCLWAVESERTGDEERGGRRRGLGARIREGLRRFRVSGRRAGGQGRVGDEAAVPDAVGQALAELAEVDRGLHELVAELTQSEAARHVGPGRADRRVGLDRSEGGAVAGPQEAEAMCEGDEGRLQGARGGGTLRGRRRGLEGQERTVGRSPVGRISSERLWKGVL